jgi:endonuclease G
MNISDRVLNNVLERARDLPKGTLKHRPFDYAPHRKRTLEPLTFAHRAGFLARGGALPSATELERLMGTNDLVDEFYLERALLAAQPVCRISICAPSGHERGCATGFLVSPRLLLTNEHVLTSAEEAAPSIAEFNYRCDIAGQPERSYRFRLRPELFFFNHEPLDFALVAVEPQAVDSSVALSAFGYHRLVPESGKALLKEWMTIIQHPGGARRQFAIRENECVDDRDRDVIWYMSDTAQGSSGAPVLNDSFQVVALHHAGVPRQDEDKNYILKNGTTVSSLADVDDSQVDWIANAGIRVSRICACLEEEAREQNGYLAELEAAMGGGDILSNAYQGRNLEKGADMNSRFNVTPAANGPRLVLGTLVLELNSGALRSPAVALPAPAAAAALPEPTSDVAEGYKEPIIDTNYETRTGFDTKFLGIETPLPKVTKKTLIAPLKDGRTVIPYEHFSIVLHKERKLAIFTASNVDGSAKAKRPEAGKSYTRKALTGLDKGQAEKWVLDSRLDAEFQIPDAFYTKDNGAFDKGHVVRREDVCFGRSFAQVQRANGDTFHVTNCSPQRGNFNQSAQGGIWGNLENFISAQADKEQYCIFAGPVLSAKDQTFSGKQPVQIPTRFWKVVCAVKNKKLQVFGFLLEQDVQDLPLEFQVNAEWKYKQRSLKDLEAIVKLVKFPKVYHNADQAKA